MPTTSQIILDPQALEENIGFLRKIMGKRTRLSSVVKANAYGHGIEHFVPMAEKAGIDHFSVFSADEAMRVYQAGSGKQEIMIMGWLDKHEMEWAIRNEISFYVFEPGRLMQAGSIAKKHRKPAHVHLEVETGMNRTGLAGGDLIKALRHIQNSSGLFRVNGLCTHFAGAESIANYYRITRQIMTFRKIQEKVLREGIKPRIRHTACSAAALNYPETRMDMVRIGIAQYGFWPSKETLIHYLHDKKKKTDPLKRVMSWKSRIMSIKKVRTGEFVSYGTTYLAQEDKRIAIIPVGYSNGYNRSLSNQGRVLIRGYRVAVIGMVNMNMLIADITAVPEAHIGDEVVMIGRQGDLEITVSSFSEISEQLNYELLARLPQNITRIVNN
ncbi:MAG: alanine racemase [Bacteroidales bacterium]|nr:alanine racemase [Bacteroidales bacterium]